MFNIGEQHAGRNIINIPCKVDEKVSSNKCEQFELANCGKETWTDTQFVELESYQNEKQCAIVLCVDWENQEATVEARANTNSTQMREWNKLDQCFSLPAMVDASQFVEYYDEKIKPLLKTRGETFESYWNGSNTVGRFESDEDDDLFFDEADINIQDACDNTPEHEIFVFFSIGDSFADYNDIIVQLKYAGIDFMTADLEDEKVVTSIMDILTDTCLFMNTDAKTELEGIRESITENMEG